MSDIAIRVENLSKLYRIGQLESAYQTLGERLSSAISTPFRALGSAHREQSKSDPTSNNTIWALKDISFEVKQGEVVGIIGPNGAGKTTLLKLLTRITRPTRGYAEIQGRVASLLEVGIGFHGELTGRENVYLNGAVLGMKRAEVQRKFDDIVDFSGVGKFIDTPLKRYSSGMQVRLAFAVAAHLEPDILLVDEVLAVGDAAFRKKSLGKMEDVAKQGRTVLFVSHNMGAIQSLCPRTLLLTDGYLEEDGETQQVIQKYLSSQSDVMIESRSLYDVPRIKGVGEDIRISKCLILDSSGNESYRLLFGEPFSICIEVITKYTMQDFSVQFGIMSFRDEVVTHARSEDRGMLFSAYPSQPLRITAQFNDLVLTPGSYWLTITILGLTILDNIPRAIEFEILGVADEGAAGKGFRPHIGNWGYIYTAPRWQRAD